MPTVTLLTQNGNSCAAHCTVVSVADMLDLAYLRSREYAEQTIWPGIKFVADGNPLVNALAAQNNSDPRRIVDEATLRWGTALTATLVCDETQKAAALTYVDGGTGLGLGALFNMMKKAGSVAAIALQDGAYYNCSYLMFNAAAPAAANYTGMHNILVTSSGGRVWYYNSNEANPTWVVDPADWRMLPNQNGNNHSYVFTGVTVVFRKK